MPKFVIEREIPEEAGFRPEHSKAISQKSCRVSARDGALRFSGSELRSQTTKLILHIRGPPMKTRLRKACPAGRFFRPTESRGIRSVDRSDNCRVARKIRWCRHARDRSSTCPATPGTLPSARQSWKWGWRVCIRIIGQTRSNSVPACLPVVRAQS